MAKGHWVLRSDLSDFDPVERAAHYAEPGDPFDVFKARERASVADSLPADVQAEVEKLEAADRIIFHLPLWWFAPPSALKDWFERVLVQGRTHDVDHRFDRGRFRVRKALFCATLADIADGFRQQNAHMRSTIERFGGHPHRNPIYGRVTSPEEATYIATGDFPHVRAAEDVTE